MPNAWRTLVTVPAMLAMVAPAFAGTGHDTSAIDRDANPAVPRGWNSDAQIAAADTACDLIVGTWAWDVVDNPIEGIGRFTADHRSSWHIAAGTPATATGLWVCDENHREITVTWSHGFVDTLTVSPDGSALAGDSTAGFRITATRIDDDPRTPVDPDGKVEQFEQQAEKADKDGSGAGPAPATETPKLARIGDLETLFHALANGMIGDESPEPFGPFFGAATGEMVATTGDVQGHDYREVSIEMSDGLWIHYVVVASAKAARDVADRALRTPEAVDETGRYRLTSWVYDLPDIAPDAEGRCGGRPLADTGRVTQVKCAYHPPESQFHVVVERKGLDITKKGALKKELARLAPSLAPALRYLERIQAAVLAGS